MDDGTVKVEDLAITPEFWRGRRVLLTGHTGFKGAWLSLWLAQMGARVRGLALDPPSSPSLFDLARVGEELEDLRGDIRDPRTVHAAVADFKPDIVIHVAAQSLVRPSYADPVGTYATNVMGTIHVLEAVRATPGIGAVLIVTSDKCYENNETQQAYRETDRLGGRDPYSASKGCAEIAAQSMQKSFFAPYAGNGHPARIATVRAGNVIGGGDWAEDRLVPDIVRACVENDGTVRLRNPTAVRPWQHVLEPLRGYLEIAERLIGKPDGVDEAWNLGADLGDARTVREIADALIARIGRGRIVVEKNGDAPHEAHFLYLDCAKAKTRLGWSPLLRFDDTIRMTAEWYANWAKGMDMTSFTRTQIADYSGRAGVSDPVMAISSRA